MSQYVWWDGTWVRDTMGKPIVVLFARNVETKEVKRFGIKGFKPYFYVADETGDMLSCYGDRIRKVEVGLPTDVKKQRMRYEKTFDADVLYDMRYVIDKGIYYGFDDELNPVDVPVMEPRICYFDIEVASPPEIFPNVKEAKYPVVLVSWYDGYTEECGVISLGGRQVRENQVVVGSEREVLETFARIVKERDFDVVTGWNSETFDVPYIMKRARKCNADVKGLSRMESRPPDERRWLGRTRIDMLDLFKDWSKPIGKQVSYRLKAIVKQPQFGGFTYPEQGAHIQQLMEEDRWEELVEYSFNDVKALRILDKKVGLFMFYEQLRRLVGVKFSDLFGRAKIVEYFLMHEGIKPMPTRVHKDKVEDYKGALVVSPQPGIHEQVATGDLKSMYPMIMLAKNLSPDIDKTIPRVIRKLMDVRDEMRQRKLDGHADAALKTSEQSLKYIINSFYGYMGFSGAKMYAPDIAGDITETGREMSKALHVVLKEMGYELVYGDSVSADTCVRVKVDGKFVERSISQLFTNISYRNGSKEYCNLSNVEVETIDDQGQLVLDRVNYVMRHKVAKQMYRVTLANEWYIDVTEDHSLFGYLNQRWMKEGEQHERLVEIKPTEIGDRVRSIVTRRGALRDCEVSMNMIPELYMLMGFHVGDGSFDKAYGMESYYMYLAAGKDVDDVVDKLVEPLVEKGFISNYWVRETGDIQYTGVRLIRLMEAIVRDVNGKCIPEFMFRENDENIALFLNGIFSADGSVSRSGTWPIIQLTITSERIAKGVGRLLNIIGIANSVWMEKKPNSYKGKVSKTHTWHVVVKDVAKFSRMVGFFIDRKSDKCDSDYEKTKGIDEKYGFVINRVVSVEPIVYDDYVYDLCVEKTHRYFANNILVHNTDSQFFKAVGSVEEALRVEKVLNEYLVKWAIDQGMDVKYAPTVKLEKIYRRIVFKRKGDSDEAAKKRYAGHLIWKDGFEKNELDYAGIELKRSDTAPITKTILEEFFNEVLIHDDLEAAQQVVVKYEKLVRNGQVKIMDVAIPKGMNVEATVESAHVKGARIGEEVFKIHFDQVNKPRLLYTKRPWPQVCIDESICEEDVLRVCEIDWAKMCDRVVVKKTKALLESLGFNWDVVVHGQKSIFDY